MHPLAIKELQDYLGHPPTQEDLDQSDLIRMGNFSQLLYKGELVGYLMHTDPPTFKSSFPAK